MLSKNKKNIKHFILKMILLTVFFLKIAEYCTDMFAKCNEAGQILYAFIFDLFMKEFIL